MVRGLREAVREGAGKGKGVAGGGKCIKGREVLPLWGNGGGMGRYWFVGKAKERLRGMGRVNGYGRPYPYIPLSSRETLSAYSRSSGVKRLSEKPSVGESFQMQFKVSISHD